jgi:dTDP-4-amino-4,6-dideoxygalactose transaminase
MSNQPIPFLDLVTPHRELEEELVAAFRQAVRSAAFVGGKELEAFEREYADYCGAKYCVGVANGTDAVRFALMASGVGKGDAVVSVSHTFIATIEAISQAGAAAEFVDIDERTYTLSPGALEEYLHACAKDRATGRPLGKRSGLPIKAVLPVHLYGQAADMDAILSIAAAYNLIVIEDAAQAQGTEYRSAAGGWKRAGTFGKAAAFSFYPGKNLGSCGEGGAVTTDDEQVAKTVRMLREHGQAKKYYHDLEGYNSRLHAIQAAFLRIKLRHLDEWNAGRRAAAARYRELLSGIPGVVVPFEPATSRRSITCT